MKLSPMVVHISLFLHQKNFTGNFSILGKSIFSKLEENCTKIKKETNESNIDTAIHKKWK